VSDTKFTVRIENASRGAGGTSGQGSGRGSAEKEAKRLQAEAKKTADAQIREAQRASKEQQKASQALYRAQNNVFLAAQKAAKKAADDTAREAKRAADAQIKEAKRASDNIAAFQKSKLQANRASFGGPTGGGLASLDKEFASRANATKKYAADVSKSVDAIFGKWQQEATKEIALAKSVDAAKQALAAKAEAYANRVGAAQARAAKKAADDQIKEDARAAKARERFHVKAGRAAGIVGTGVVGAARSVGQAASAGVAGIASGGLLGLAGSVPRAVGDLAGEGLKAAGSLVGALGKGVAELLPGALKIVPNIIGGAFALVGELAGSLASAAGQIAGFIGDKLGLALKVSLGAAVGIGIAGISQALKADQLIPFFEQFAAASGKTAKEGIDQLKDATDGLISTTDLLRASNTAYLNESVQNLNQFQELAKYADAFADAAGTRPVEALNALTASIGGLNARGLKPIGITTVSFKKAMDSLGDSATEAEQRTAAYNIVLDALRKKFDGVAQSASGETSDSFDRLKASISDSLLAIGGSLLPALDSVLKGIEPIAKAVGVFFEKNNETTAKSIQGAIGGITDKLKDLPAIISTIKLDQVFQLASLEGQKLWVQFKAAAKGAIDFVSGHLKALALDNAVVIGLITGGKVGALAGAALKVKEHVKAGGGAFDDENAGVVALRNKADNATFTPQGAEATEFTRLEAELRALRETIKSAAGLGASTQALPASPVSQGGPLFQESKLASRRNDAGTSTGSGSGGAEAAVQAIGAAGQRVAGAIDLVATQTVAARGALASALQVQIATARKEVDAAKERFQHERTLAGLAKKQADEIQSSHEREAAARKAIADSTEAAAADIVAKRDAAIASNNAGLNQRTAARSTSGLVGEAQEVDETDGLPLTVVKALRKLKKQARKEKFEGIRDDPLMAGASSNSLAADPKRLQKILDNANLKAAEDLKALQDQKVQALAKLAADFTKTNDESKALHKRELDLMDEAAKILAAHKKDIEAQEKRVTKLENDYKAITTK